MGAAKTLILAGVTAMLGTAAMAADLPAMPPMLPVVEVPMETSGWYLRGDVGVGSTSMKGFGFHPTNPEFVTDFAISPGGYSVGDQSFVGFGVGYAWNNWLRFDVTGEYRAKAAFHAIGSYTQGEPAGVFQDVYDGNWKSYVFMANAYIDLGTWWCLTPFIGAGIGGAYNVVSEFTDYGPQTAGYGYMSGSSKDWTLAWALHAGVAYNVSSNLKIEFAYRYLNMGSVDTGIINCSISTCQTDGARAFYTLENLSSHDFRIGVRWMFQDEKPVYQPPLVRKG
jgi:opacity protein-like surface antigen